MLVSMVTVVKFALILLTLGNTRLVAAKRSRLCKYKITLEIYEGAFRSVFPDSTCRPICALSVGNDAIGMWSMTKTKH